MSLIVFILLATKLLPIPEADDHDASRKKFKLRFGVSTTRREPEVEVLDNKTFKSIYGGEKKVTRRLG